MRIDDIIAALEERNRTIRLGKLSQLNPTTEELATAHGQIVAREATTNTGKKTGQ